MAILKVVSVSTPKLASTGNGTYKTVKFAEFNERCNIMMPTGVTATRNFWSDRLNSEGNVIKGDRLFDMISDIQYLDGADIEWINASKSYTDNNGTLRNKTCVVVLKGEDKYSLANREFSSHGVVAMDADGVLHGDLKETTERNEKKSERAAKLEALLIAKGLKKPVVVENATPADVTAEPVDEKSTAPTE